MAFARDEWTSRPPRSLARDGRKHTLVIHHSAGSGLNIDTVPEQKAALRSIQNFHMDHNGWSDIGYGLVCFQPRGRVKKARLYFARPLWAIPAAQAGANSGTIPLCVVANDEPIVEETIDRIVAAAESLKETWGITKVRGHRDLTPTDCPGRHLYSLLPTIRRRTGLK